MHNKQNLNSGSDGCVGGWCSWSRRQHAQVPNIYSCFRAHKQPAAGLLSL